MTTVEDQEYGWNEKIQKHHENEFYRQQAKSLANKEYHEYAALFLRVMTDDDIFTHIKWSIADTAWYFGVKNHVVRRWIATGKLKAEHELTETKGAAHARWRWWIYVKDVQELEEEFKKIQDTTIARRYKVDAVWRARIDIVRVKAAQSTQGQRPS